MSKRIKYPKYSGAIQIVPNIVHIKKTLLHQLRHKEMLNEDEEVNEQKDNLSALKYFWICRYDTVISAALDQPQ